MEHLDRSKIKNRKKKPYCSMLENDSALIPHNRNNSLSLTLGTIYLIICFGAVIISAAV